MRFLIRTCLSTYGVVLWIMPWVRTSTTMCFVGQYSNQISPFSTHFRRKWCCTSMRFVRAWWVGFFINDIAPWLSHQITITFFSSMYPKSIINFVVTPLWAKCEDETHTPKSGNLESSGTPATSELDRRGQKTSPWGVLYTVEKVLKCRCPKWPRMSHLDICSPSYGQKKGQESNWQFDSRPLKVGNQPLLDVCRRSATRHWKAFEESYNFGLDLTPIGGRSREI
jgi:hypothetical protein